MEKNKTISFKLNLEQIERLKKDEPKLYSLLLSDATPLLEAIPVPKTVHQIVNAAACWHEKRHYKNGDYSHYCTEFENASGLVNGLACSTCEWYFSYADIDPEDPLGPFYRKIE